MKRVYRGAGPALLRAARASHAQGPSTWPDLTGKSHTDLRNWIVKTWTDPAAEAIRVASPSLARSLDRLASGEKVTGKQLRRIAISLSRYLLRATGRATPFGLFAGTAPIRFTGAGKIRWGDHHQVIVCADSAWLDTAISRLESIPGVLQQLNVLANNMIRRRGAHIVLPAGAQRIEIDSTAPARAALRIASTPVGVAELAGRLAYEFPQAPHAKVMQMISGLVSHGFLVTSLRAPGTAGDPVTHLSQELARTRSDRDPEAVQIATQARAVRAITGERDQRSAGELAACRGSGLLALDLRLDCDVRVPREVVGEVEAAASALLRLSPYPRGHPIWRDYYQEFVHRYGASGLVPLTDVVDPDMGLGFPARYPGTLRPSPPERSLERDQSLLTLAQRATAAKVREVVLDDALIESLSAGDPAAAGVPPHVEIAARVYAPTLAAIEAGDFTVSVRPARAVGVMTGRFAPADSEMAELYASLPTAVEGAITAQLMFAPLEASAGNIARTPRFLDHIICLGGYRLAGQRGVIEVSDLALLANRQRLHLVHVPTRRVVEPQVLHGLALDHKAPPLARFLANLSWGCSTWFTRFEWGPADALPFLPRVRYGRAQLSPARWRLAATELADRHAEFLAWTATLDGWRTVWQVPRWVELVEGDQRLPLDLDEPAHAALLRHHLEKVGSALLAEASRPTDMGWLDNHAHEIIVPLISTAQPAPSPLASPRTAMTTDRKRGQAPGQPDARWLFAKVYAHPDRQDEILTDQIPALLAELADPEWWFIRYRAPGDPDHLRIRLRVHSPRDAGEFVAVLGAWGRRLRVDGLSPRIALDTYYPEIGRYGNGAVLEAAEAVFVADSAAVIASLRLGSAVDPRAAAAVGMTRVTAAFTGGTGPGTRWLIHHPHDQRAEPAPRSVLQQALALAHGKVEQPQAAALVAALHGYRDRLEQAGAPEPDGVLWSLLHLHHIRAVGVDRAHERTCYRLARQIALSRTARWTEPQ